MATEHAVTTRRTWLGQAAIAGLSPWLGSVASSSQGESPATLVAAWQTLDAHHIGLIETDAVQWRVARSLTVPTRAHGLSVQSNGSVLALARRPGNWLLRWHPTTGDTQWQWIEGDRRFNGHAVTDPQSGRVWTTETDLQTAQGLLGVRDHDSLEKTGEWSTHGMDPHAVMLLPQAMGRIPAGSVMVANGGIAALPETGRAKRDGVRMDASLVALSAHSGAVLGQWRLADPYLSIRHLAWDPVSRRLGIALQAEHSNGKQKQAAPVLAVWDGEQLLPSVAQPDLQGYGGDICALPGGGFVVSCPRANTLALFTSAAVWTRTLGHREGGALTARVNQWWAGGHDGVLTVNLAQSTTLVQSRATSARIQFDNHWQYGPSL